MKQGNIKHTMRWGIIIMALLGGILVILLYLKQQNMIFNKSADEVSNEKSNLLSDSQEVSENQEVSKNQDESDINSQDEGSTDERDANQALTDQAAIEEEKEQDSFQIMKITDDIFKRIEGKSYGEECEIALSSLRYLKVLYYGFDGKTHNGELIVNEEIAEDTLSVFKELYEVEYPIEQMVLVDEYDADDNASMLADNTSAFNFRMVEGINHYSNHSFGYAIDINPFYNPYVKGNEVFPSEAAQYADRTKSCPYYISKDDVCYQIFTKYGFEWGGNWNSCKDYQHFEKVMNN